MCGIWCYLSKSGQLKVERGSLAANDLTKLYQAFMATRSRGPDTSSFNLVRDRLLLGFHRLAINDLSPLANQPFQILDKETNTSYYALTNGEIYQHHELHSRHELYSTPSVCDCEVILPLYRKLGLDKTARLLGSEFASIIAEIDNKGQIKVMAMRDPIGVRPLFWAIDAHGLCLSSEIKSLTPIFGAVHVFPPGHHMLFEEGASQPIFTEYHSFVYRPIDTLLQSAMDSIRKLFTAAVHRRLMTDRPLGCLLSGGLDSSLVVGVAKQLRPDLDFPVFTIAFKSGGTDLPYAIKVAKFLGLTNHHIIEIDETAALSEIDETIHAIESYDITTIRASTMQRIVAKYVQKNTNVKVLLCGENSDEMFCGYKYFHLAPTVDEMHSEAVRLVRDVHRFDGLRTDRTMAHHGLEVRLPFADIDLVDYVFSLPQHMLAPQSNVEKSILRESFKGDKIIPHDVLFRSKEALSDGCSSLKKSWFQIIQEHIDTVVTDREFEESRHAFKHLPPPTKEAYYYRKKFVEYFGASEEVAKVIPYYWMPKWVGSSVTDPSARTLAVYSPEGGKAEE